jgi:signal transduction histidine kinase
MDVQESIEMTLRLLRPRWADRITIHRDYEPLPPIEAVAGHINQVLMNLLANACDAIPGRGNIWLHTTASGTTICVSIREDGVGIAADHLHRIFEPFFTTKPLGEGTGLGLAITHGIVASHGGKIQVASQPGRGSEFSVVLPVHPAMSDDGIATRTEEAVHDGISIPAGDDVAPTGTRMYSRGGLPVA